MNTIEAFYFAMTKINELKEQGIGVEITPYNFIDKKHKAELLKEYSKEENIPHEKWCGVNFRVNNDADAKKISEVGNYLGMCGMSFDTGGCANNRDWEFDWSFSYVKGSENWEWKEAREVVEDLISKMTCSNES